ncbi:cytochrome P450 [Amanita rubescens]|nr:cytochrome P450 [Amanita rubescens]KAF8338420.1 cytochrome P450 [Amanita rubescens]
MENVAVVTLSALLGLTLAAVLYLNRTRHQYDLPPGPAPRLFSGSTYQIPSSEPWKAYAKWSQVYGSPLIHLLISGKPTIVINSARAAIDLLEARSNIYSDRPRSHVSASSSVPSQNAPVSMASYLLRPFTWIFTPWSPRAILGDRPTIFGTSVMHPRFKKYRKLLQTSLNPRAVKKYTSLMEQERLVMLRGMSQHPEDFVRHVRRNAGAVILSVAYGWKVTSNDDYFVRLNEEAFSIHNLIKKPSGWLVEFFPLLRFLPSWFPGNGYKRRAAHFKDRIWQFDNVPHRWAKEQIESGKFTESFSSQHLRPEDGHMVDGEEEDIVKWASSALYFGGADTTVGSVLSFILLMTLYPDVQKRAQDEIDRVVGKDRLPSIDDQDELVYVGALIKEVLRFAPVAPLGLAHRAMEEDVYMGYRIPQDATVITNIWAIAHDEEVFDRPFDFDPNRFLDSDDPNRARIDPRKLVFGYGRRVCPGAHFAELSIYLSITGILAMFNIRKQNQDGVEITPKFEFTTGITSHPKPFVCQIEPHRADPLPHVDIL